MDPDYGTLYTFRPRFISDDITEIPIEFEANITKEYPLYLEKKEGVEELTVYQNGEKLTPSADGTYMVSDACKTVIDIKTKDKKYTPAITWSEKDNDPEATYPYAEYYDIYDGSIIQLEDDGNEWRKSFSKPYCKQQVSVSAMHYSKFTVDSELELSLRFKCPVSEDYELRENYRYVEPLTDDEGNLYYMVPDATGTYYENGFYFYGWMDWPREYSLDSEFKSLIEPISADKRPFHSEIDYTLYPINLTEDAVLYSRKVAKKLPVAFDEDIPLTYYIPLKEDGSPEYSVSADKKTISLSQDTTVVLRINDLSGKYRVYEEYNYSEQITDTERKYWIENHEVDGTIDENGRYREYNIYSGSGISRIKIYKEKDVNFSLAKNHCNVYMLDKDSDETVILSGGAAALAGKEINLKVVPEEGYTFRSAKITDASGKLITPQIDETEEATYLSFILNDSANISVNCVPAPSQLYISNLSSKVKKCSLETGEKVKLGGEGEYYNVQYDAGMINFTTTVPAGSAIDPQNPGFEVYVVNENQEITVVPLKGYTSDDNAYKFTYRISSTTLLGESYLYVADAGERTIKVSFGGNGITTDNLVLRDAEGLTVTPDVNEAEGVVTYKCAQGKAYDLDISTADEYCVGNVDIYYADNNFSKNVSVGQTIIKIPVASDVEVVIVPIGRRQAVMREAKTSYEMPAMSSTRFAGNYNLVEGNVYIFSLEAENENANIVRVYGKNKKNYVDYNFEKPVQYLYFAPDGEDTGALEKDYPVIRYQNDLSVTTQFFYLKMEDGSKYTLQLSVSEAPEELMLKYKGNDGAILAAGARRVITIKGSGKTFRNVSFAGIKIYAVDKNGDAIGSYDDPLGVNREKLEMKLIQSVSGSTARLNVTAGDCGGLEGSIIFENLFTGKKIAVLPFEVWECRLTTSEVNAEVKSADDISATLSFANTGQIATGSNDEQYFMIEATPKGDFDKNIFADKVTRFVKIERPEYPEMGEDESSEAYDAKIEKIDKAFRQKARVILGRDGVRSGNGGACSFNLKITPVQFKPGVTLADIESGSAVVGTDTAWFGTAKEIDASTLTPVIETNLKLKNAVKSVFSGQSDILIATPVFSKNTTCKELIAEDVTNCDDKQRFIIRTDEEGNIYATIPQCAEPAPHLIRVLPAANLSAAYLATTTIKVTSGISKIEVTPSSTRIYKAPSKAVSLSVTAVCNNGKIKAGKNVIYKLVNSEGEEFDAGSDELKALSISGTKIKVSKDYDASANGDLTFRIKAIANDFEGNTTYALSKPVTITAQTIGIGDVKLFKYDEETRCYKVISSQNLTTADVEGAAVAAFPKEAEVKDEYFATEFSSESLPLEYYSLTSKTKSVSVEKQNGVYVLHCTKPAKKVKLIATAVDGAKTADSSRTIEFGVDYYKPAALQAVFFADGNEISGPEYTCNLGENKNVKLKVMEVTQEGVLELPGLANYTIAVKGAKLTSKNFVTGEFEFTAAPGDVTVTLTDKSRDKKDPAAKLIYRINFK